MPTTFNMVLGLKTEEKLKDTVLIVLANDSGGYLLLGYDARLAEFYLRASDGVTITLPVKLVDGVDYLTFGISQDTSLRRLYFNSYNKNLTTYQEAEAGTVGVLDKLYCYPKLA